MPTRARTLFLLATLSAACGGGPTSPGGGPSATPTPPGSPVSGFLFYDENSNGIADGGELVRLPSVGVSIGGQTGTTTPGGRFSLPSVPNRAHTAQARGETPPPSFPPPGGGVRVPPGGAVPVPARLALGARVRPNVYLAFGDSIPFGTGSSDEEGYGGGPPPHLRGVWGRPAPGDP